MECYESKFEAGDDHDAIITLHRPESRRDA